MNASKHELYKTWNGIVTRCFNENHANYKRYGAKGIFMSKSWKSSFWNFVTDMGERPSTKHQVDRINNSKGYSKNNCRWVTSSQNCRNKSNNLILSHKGKTLLAIEWAEILGVHKSTIGRRLRNGWSIEKTLTTPQISNKVNNKNLNKRRSLL